VPEKEHRKTLTAIILLGVVLVIIGLVENQALGGVTGHRVTGPFRFWENYGLTLLVVFYVLWYKLNSIEMNGSRILFYNMLIVLVAYCIFLTETRTIMLALIIGTAIIYMKGFKYLHRKTFYFYLSISLVVIASIIISPTLLKSTSFYQHRLMKKETADGRIETYKVAARMFSTNPVMGIGIRNFKDEMETYATGMELKYSVFGGSTLHNSYLVLAAETGITGLIPFLLIILLAYRFSNRLTLSENKNDRLWGLMMVGLTVSYFFCGLFFDPFFEPTIDNKLYYLCLGITAGKLAGGSEDRQ
jgi:O-antigen ligase